MKKVNVVKRDDYESYRIYVPLKVRAKFNSNKFIFSELEKLHPCFSSDFCIDSRRKFYKGRFFHDVIVMNKYKLAEYRKNFPDQNIFLDTGRKVFKLRKSIKKLFFGITAVFLLGVMGFIQLRYKFRINTEKRIQTDYEESIENQFEYYNLSRNLFENVRVGKGKIDFFEWKKDNWCEDCTVAVKFLFPEQLSQLQGNKIFSPVKNTGEKTYFTVQMKNNLGAEKTNKTEMKYDRSYIRGIFASEKVLILEESYEPVSYKFVSMDDYKYEESLLFTKLEEAAESYGLVVQKIFIKGGNQNELTGEITFTNTLDSKNGLVLKDIDKNMDLFFEISDKKTVPIVENEKRIAIPGVKFGEIKKRDGKTVVFYKTEKGKIIKVEN